jgi:hypothetical protein
MADIISRKKHIEKMTIVAEHFEKALIEASCDVIALELKFSDTEKDEAIITWDGGNQRRINIDGDSPRAMMEDILDKAWR